MVLKNNSLLPYITIFLIALVTRFPLIEKFQSHWDGPDYSIAILSYSLENNTPTAPGYPLYIAFGKLVNFLFHDPHLSLLFISVLVTALGSVVIIFVVKRIFNYQSGLIASLLYLTGSTFYFFSLTPYGYVTLPLLNILLAYVVYLSFLNKKNVGLLLGIVVGIFFGIRPQEMIQVGLLALLGFVSLKNKQRIVFLITFFAITSSWLIPQILDTGGIKNYLEINFSRADSGLFVYSIAHNLEAMIKGFLLSFGIASIFMLFYGRKIVKETSIITKNKKIILFFTAWIVPSLLFNLIVRSDHAGYQMTYLTAFLILISYGIYKTFKNKKLLILATAILCGFNLYWFFYDRDPNFEKPFKPTSFHYSDIRKNDLIIGSKVNYVRENFDSGNTLLVSTEVAWRMYSYYLKSYEIVALNALDNKEAPYIYNKFTGRNWNQERSQSKEFSLKIPDNISRIILMDTAMSNWVVGKDYKVVNLSANSSVTIISVKKDSTMLYDYHFIKFSN